MQKITLKILGKERILIKPNCLDEFFLNEIRDCNETGIFCSLSLAEWKDDEYLKKIASRIYK